MERTGLEAYTKCIKCGKTIAVTRQFITDEGFTYKDDGIRCGRQDVPHRESQERRMVRQIQG